MRAKHVNTCSYDIEAAARVELRVLDCCHIDRGRLYECNGVRIIVLGALKVEILNVHVFAHEHGPVY